MFIANLWSAEGRSFLHERGWRNAVGFEGNQSTRDPHSRLEQTSIRRFVIERSGCLHRLALQFESPRAADFVAVAIR